MPSVKPAAQDVSAEFFYHKDPEDGGAPHPTYVGKPEIYERRNVTRIMVVHDIRGEEEHYTLDGNSFQIWKRDSEEKDFVDEEQIKRVYYPGVKSILKQTTGASQIFIFDHTVRRPAPTDEPLRASRGPVRQVHVDQSYDAGPQRVRYHLPESAAHLLRGRYQIINVWRPIRKIRKDPLAVADAQSITQDDLIPVPLIYPDWDGETFRVRPSEKHRWFYLADQAPSETLLIKCFDSFADGRARRAPHSAFGLKGREGEAGTESIEVRALVLHPPTDDGK